MPDPKIGLAWHVDGKMAETDDDDVDDAVAPCSYEQRQV